MFIRPASNLVIPGPQVVVLPTHRRRHPVTAAPAPVARGHREAGRLAPPEDTQLGLGDWLSCHFGRLRGAHKQPVAALVERAITAAQTGNDRDAARLCRVISSKLTTADGGACAVLGAHLCDLGRFDEAKPFLLVARQLGALTETATTVRLAYVLLHEGSANGAVNLLSERVRNDCTNPQLLSVLGTAWLVSGLLRAHNDAAAFAAARDEATKSFRLASACAPTDATLQANLALCQQVYPGPYYGNVGAFLPPLHKQTSTELRAPIIGALTRGATYHTGRTTTVGRAVRRFIREHERPENAAAIARLQERGA